MITENTYLTFKRSTDNEPIIATGLIDVPALAGDRNMIDITTLADDSLKYTPGLKEPGDLPMVFLYDNSSDNSPYRVFRKAGDGKEVIEFALTLPDGTKFEYTGIPTVTVDDITVNDRITFTCKVALKSNIIVTDPSDDY